jgi:hypothetical protein
MTKLHMTRHRMGVVLFLVAGMILITPRGQVGVFE